MNVVAISAGLLSACALVSFGRSALADPPGKPQRYEYNFSDDRLLGGEPQPGGAMIPVVNMKRRDQLVRPRLQFVHEMLKSVESM
jgi:hypothetical protein